MSPLDPKKRGWILALALLLSVFMAGALTAGAVIQVMAARGSPFIRRPVAVAGPGPRLGLGAPRPAGLWDVQRMAIRLGLSEDQTEAIRDIMEERERQAAEIMEDMRPRLQATLDSAVEDIRNVLRPEQREEFDRLRLQGRERLFQRFGPPPGRGRRPPGP